MDSHSPVIPSTTSLSMAAKRPCPSQNPRAENNLGEVERRLEAFLSLSHVASLSLDLSFERLLQSLPSDSDSDLIDRALKMASLLLDAAKHSSRKRASNHNSLSWPLPPDLTIKVFSMLDTQSLCYASATCLLFSKCAKDPMCYANLDLTTLVPKVNNAVVATMIQRAGKGLRSLKLGVVPSAATSLGSCPPFVCTIRNAIVEVPNFSWNDKRSRQGRESSILTRCCLSPLSGDGGAPGALLRKLHLYNIERMDNASLGAALSACPSLLDLEIVGLHVELRQTLMSVSANCHLIEHLFFLVFGFRKLKYVDFSTSYSITGNFLRNLGSCNGGNLLEVLILRDCMHLKEMEVARLLTAILAGDFKLLVHLDISNREGLASEADWYHRCYNSSIMPTKQVLEARPDMCLVAEYPSAEGSYIETFDADMNSEISLPSQLSSHTSDGSIFMSTSESSYNSDQGSGNEDGQDANYVIYEESSDEIDFLSL
ncbi:F-box protein SKIP17 [Glycine soja]|nr:F-box protein SKIP17 [Glycine soja]